MKSVINKIFGKFGNIINEYYPLNENGHTKGYIFLEYASPLHAIEAVKITNNYKLDKQHTFLVNLFTDFSKYENIPEKWDPPQPQPYEGQTDLHYYLLEPDAYDQYCVVKAPGQGQSVQIWQNTQPDPTLLEDRQVSKFNYIFMWKTDQVVCLICRRGRILMLNGLLLGHICLHSTKEALLYGVDPILNSTKNSHTPWSNS